MVFLSLLLFFFGILATVAADPPSPAPESCSAAPPAPLALFSIHAFSDADPDSPTPLFISGFDDKLVEHPAVAGKVFFRLDVFDNDSLDSIKDRLFDISHSRFGRDKEIEIHDQRIVHVLNQLPLDYCSPSPSPSGTNTLPPPLAQITSLYAKYKGELIVLRERAKLFRPHVIDASGLCADGYGDLEAEITYMRLREQRPSRVLELSPNCGWSSFYLLSALAKNEHGTLDSFDMHDCSRHIVDTHLPDLAPLRTLHLGDAFAPDGALMGEGVSDAFDYFFIDSEHSYEFATRVVDVLFRTRSNPTLVGSIHDTYNKNHLPSEEAQAFLEYFAAMSGDRELFTASPMKDMGNYAQLVRARVELGVGGDVRDNVAPCKWLFCANGSLFFNLVQY